jgi:hypothetical protein
MGDERPERKRRAGSGRTVRDNSQPVKDQAHGIRSPSAGAARHSDVSTRGMALGRRLYRILKNRIHAPRPSDGSPYPPRNRWGGGHLS